MKVAGAALLLTILFSRRAGALLDPGVWCEDGTQVLPSLLLHGPGGFLQPVNGYLITNSKLISAVALAFGLNNYPFASSLLALFFSLLCVLAVWLFPTHLHYKFFCALGCVLVPTDPECFGTPLYSFWWAGLIVLLLVLWRAESDGWIVRMGLLAFAGLSSPLIVAAVPFFWLRAFICRRKYQEWLLALVTTVIAALQLSFIKHHDSSNGLFAFFGYVANKFSTSGAFHEAAAVWIPASLGIDHTIAAKIAAVCLFPLLVAAKFLGAFAAWHLSANQFVQFSVQIVAALALVYVLFRSAKIWDRWLVFLLGLYLATVVISMVRVNPAILDPVLAGPRYFFYPFILLSWIFLYLVRQTEGALRNACLAICALAAVNSAFSWSREHVSLQWNDHLRSAACFDSYAMPIFFDGNMHSHWRSEFFGGMVVPWSDADMIMQGGRTFPFRVASALSPGSAEAALVTPTPLGSDPDRSELEGIETMGSFMSSDADTGAIEIKMKRGAQILFKTGSFQSPGWGTISVVGGEEVFFDEIPSGCIDWTVFDFSNRKLPPEFRVRFTDAGQGPGEWLAVGVRKAFNDHQSNP